VLGKLARQHDPNVLVGFDHADDAGVYQIAPDTALVQTVDFFTPIVDDPYTFGQIAATNSLSDVYAMGGKPLTALALVCFPEKGDLEILERILAGGLSKMVEAGCTVVGGHSIRDDETKFGYSVTGLINPKRVLQNGGARAGDHLLLTKSLGTGVISTAIKKGVAEQEWIDAAVASMTTLNKSAAEVIRGEDSISNAHVGTGVHARPAVQSPAPDGEVGSNTGELRSSRTGGSPVPTQSMPPQAFPVHALTDITGFGLIGHLREMLLASDNVSAEIHAGSVPLIEGALECVRAGYIPGGLTANRDFAECVVNYEGGVPEELKTMLFDPQTAGGLLIAVDAKQSATLKSALLSAGVISADIGEVVPKRGSLITVTQ
jgi:selenide, water dikinase